jgi:hypothetical protein
MRFPLLILALIVLPVAQGDEWPAAVSREAFSQSRTYFVRVVPGTSAGDTVGFSGAPKDHLQLQSFIASKRTGPIAITSAFLLVRSAFACLAGFFVLRFVAGASAASVLVFSESMLILLFSFCRKLVAGVTSHHSGSEKWQAESGRDCNR